MQIGINLATRPYVDDESFIRRMRLCSIALFTLCAFLAVALYARTRAERSSQSEDRRIESQLAAASLELNQNRRLMQQPESLRIAVRIAALNQLFAEKSLSWTLLLRDFEGVVPQGVQLATIQPVREKDGGMSLNLHIVGPRARILDLLQALDSSNNFVLPRVVSENVQDTPHPNQSPSALSESTIEEFDIVTGYTPSGAAPAGGMK